jgi:hypothetical protein
VDSAGNVYATEGPLEYEFGELGSGYNSSLFEISPAGTAQTLQEWTSQNANIFSGLQALPTPLTGVAVDGAGVVYILANGILEKSSLASGPALSIPPQSQTVSSGGTVTLAATASSNPPPSYQWSFNGTAISGATGSSLTLSDVSPAQAGNYSVTASTTYGSATSSVANLTVTGSAAHLINISTRAQVGTGANIIISGFAVGGSGTETLLIRGDGPGLTQFSVPGVLAKPSLTVFDSSGTVIASNTGWGANSDPALIVSTSNSVGAFAFQSGSADCALIVSLQPGTYTAQVSGVNNSTGVALAEIYEVSSAGTRLINISTRAQVGTGANILIPGFVIAGGGNEQLLVRADGPSLAQFNLTGVLAEPSLTLLDTTGDVRAANTGWGTSADASEIASADATVGAFPLVAGSADSAQIVNLTEGAYTMQISGVNSTTGLALAEVYEIPVAP